MLRILYFILSLFLGSVVVGACVLVYFFWHFQKDLPDYQFLKTYHPSITTRLYAKDGALMAELAKENRLFVPIEAMPDLVKQAFISAEDKSFYSHPGVDFMGVVRAVARNLRDYARGKRMQGASTITQQVATNFLLNRSQSLEYKIRQILLSFRLEKAFSKNELLELYLNEIYLGGGAYGVAAASLHYFHKPLDALQPEEAAYLAALPKAPNHYHPVRHYDKAIGRRNWVLMRMYEDGVLNLDELKIAQATKLQTYKEPKQIGNPYGYFTEEVRRDLIEQFGFANVYEQGLMVRTTMDPHLQNIAVQALRRGLAEFDRKKGWRGALAKIDTQDNWQEALSKLELPKGAGEWKLAVILADKQWGLVDGTKIEIPKSEWAWASQSKHPLQLGDVVLVEKALDNNKAPLYILRQIPLISGAIIAMNPHSGRIYALVGGFSFEISEFNRATQALRQPGSAFKPFIYLAALEAGYSPQTQIEDAPIALYQGPGLPLWTPKNYSGEYYGWTALRVGVEKSRNLMTVRLANALGMERIQDVAKRFGIYDNLPPHLSYSLGAGETTVLKLTTAYAMLANGGQEIKPHFVERIQNRFGTTIYRLAETSCQLCGQPFQNGDQRPFIANNGVAIADARYTYQMISILEGVVKRGTATSLLSLNRPILGKTGTTNDSNDTWFIGSTPHLTVGVYVGYDQPKSLGKRETGSSVAAPIFKYFMEEALKDTPAQAFPIPEGLVFVELEDGVREAFLPGTEPGSGFAKDVYWGNEYLYDYQNNGEYDEEDHNNRDNLYKGGPAHAPGILY